MSTMGASTVGASTVGASTVGASTVRASTVGASAAKILTVKIFTVKILTVKIFRQCASKQLIEYVESYADEETPEGDNAMILAVNTLSSVKDQVLEMFERANRECTPESVRVVVFGDLGTDTQSNILELMDYFGKILWLTPKNLVPSIGEYLKRG